MKQFLIYAHCLLAVLAAGLLTSCSSDDECVNPTSSTFSLGAIEVNPFPVFGTTDSRVIGTPDAGKTSWVEADVLLLKAEVFADAECTGAAEQTQYTQMTYTDGAWAFAEGDKIDLSVSSDACGIRLSAFYAPSYQWTEGEAVPQLQSGASAGTQEYLTTSSSLAYTSLVAGEKLAVAFGADCRAYSRLRVVATPDMAVTLTAADFTTNDGTTTAESGITATADEKGNAYFYGTWIAKSEAVISTDAVRTYGTIENKTKRITLPTAETAKSYAVAGPKWVIDHSCYYYWDASSSIVDGEYDNKELLASNSCKDCPTARQLVKYLNKGYYYDDGTIETEGWQTYTILTGESKTPTDFHTGLWLPKKSTIDGFDDETTGGQTIWIKSIADEHKITAANAAEIRTKGNYFFLPATGYGNSSQNGSSVSFAGTSGQYWSKTSEEMFDDHVAYDLYFNSERIFVTADFLGGYAYVPMVIE